jgi:hypothetical protein
MLNCEWGGLFACQEIFALKSRTAAIEGIGQESQAKERRGLRSEEALCTISASHAPGSQAVRSRPVTALTFFELQDNQIYRKVEKRKDGTWFKARYTACTYDAIELIRKAHCNL